MMGECRCPDCARLCQGHPGRFDPGQATKAAAHLGLSIREFFNKFLTVDFFVGEGYEVDMLSPAWGGNNGRRASLSDGFKRAPCALLTPTGCSLPLDLRPSECTIAFGCDKKSTPFKLSALARKWNTPEGFKELAEAKGD